MYSTKGITLGELAERIDGAVLRGKPTVRVTGVQHDSREVQPGDLFACIVGQRHDGHEYAGDAVARGAVGLLVSRDRPTVLLPDVPCLLVEDTRLALPAAASAVFGEPSRSLEVVGVTGTNGKTTTTAMVEAIARATGRKTGRIGTLGATALGEDLPCAHTTPEADDLQRLFALMLERGVTTVAMEVSSHGLALHRTDCTAFRVGVFQNLTQDHLDYHGDLSAYFAAKLRLFTEYPRWSPHGFTAVVNLDDPRGSEVAQATVGQVITFGTSANADIRANVITARADETRFLVDGLCGRMEICLPIGGLFQVANALGAIGAAMALGFSASSIVTGLHSMRPVPGRFEAVPTGRPWSVIVDFAHTPDGLQSLLTSARALKPSRLILVFGCGGNRDRTKRPIMGRIAGEGADVVVVTSDNPRHEKPEDIIQEILPGIRGTDAEVHVEPDRRKATHLALSLARGGDLVLLAGKGGEREMIVGDERIPYDDTVVVRELLEQLP